MEENTDFSLLYRYENKYFLSKELLEITRLKVNSICERDSHAGEDGRYLIRSLYFDDYYDSAYMANEKGIEPRSKWRIRAYNNDFDRLSLERKSKNHGLIHKDSTIVSKELVRNLLSGEYLKFPIEDPLINQFIIEVETKLLKPIIIIQYNREPYVEHAGDVRITFDTGMCFSYDTEEFFNKDAFLQPLQIEPCDLLEVKYTEIFPKQIQRVLDTGKLQRTTFSKYYLSRQMGDVNHYGNI